MTDTDVQHLIDALHNAGWRTEEISAEPLIVNVYEQSIQGEDGYRFTITATVTE